MTLDESKEKVKIQDWVNEKFKDNLTGRMIQQLFTQSDLVDSIYEYSQVKFNEFEEQILGLLNKYYGVYERFPDLKESMESIKELRKQIEKMKYCSNCGNPNNPEVMDDICTTCNNYSKWEIQK